MFYHRHAMAAIGRLRSSGRSATIARMRTYAGNHFALRLVSGLIATVRCLVDDVDKEGEEMRLLNRCRFSRVSLRAASFLFFALFSTAPFAGVIYEYRADGSPTVIGRLEVASPPAGTSIGWSTAVPSDLIALFLDDAVFGLGSANLLFVGGTLGPPEIISIDGTKLDGGGIGIEFPTILPVVPTDPTIDQTLSILFGPSSGGDFIGVATRSTFPDDSIVIGDLFIDGNWVAQIPEPGTLILLGIGLVGVGWSASRTRPTCMASREASQTNRAAARLRHSKRLSLCGAQCP